MENLTETKLYPFWCKAFIPNENKLGEGEWIGLGTVYAKDNTEAWKIAHKNWKQVDSVYDLYSCD